MSLTASEFEMQQASITNQPWEIPMSVKRKSSIAKLTPGKAEQLTKAAARKRQIVIELSDEQMATLSKQYAKLNAAEAMELIFTLKKRPTSKLKIAGYSYHGDTCCV